MGFMDGMMGKSAARDRTIKALSVSDVEKMGGFDPILDLKKGDKLQWKGREYKTARVPAIGQTIEVLEIIPAEPDQTGGLYHRDDFLFAGVNDDGDLCVWALDSRRFKRVKK